MSAIPARCDYSRVKGLHNTATTPTNNANKSQRQADPRLADARLDAWIRDEAEYSVF